MQAERSAEMMRVLVVEDNPGDAVLISAQLGNAASEFELVHVQTLREAKSEFDRAPCQLILLDLGLPDGQGLDSVRIARRELGDVPIVVLTGSDDEHVASDALAEGAHDFLTKGEQARAGLVSALRLARARHAIIDGRDRLIQELQTALRRQRGASLLPICAGCKKIRGRDGAWEEIEVFLARTIHVDMTHGICPECTSQLHEDLDHRPGSRD